MNSQLSTFWNLPAKQVFGQVQSTPQGLTSEDAKQRLSKYGANSLKQKQHSHTLTLLLNQFNSPIILILMAAAILSSFLKDTIDAVIILVIVLTSGLLGFWQERGAADAVQKLLELVEIKASILRDGKAQDVPVDEVMPGDIVLLSAGNSIPGDCLVLESQTLSVDEATLTGETYPVPKEPGVLPAETGLGQRTNSLFMGTHVVSGSATAVVVNTGKATEFGKVSERLKFRPPETEFENGIRKFGYFLLEVTLTSQKEQFLTFSLSAPR
ncbi:cation-transporting P-type ATPase [Dolichospermum sp. ST_sed1]|nr:cation-transporting P-type ATPase [Dolichospermum sp. ST_sed1]MDD1427140.1 cation-transporting P-type ATPase [Dolichospermum sp. ST_sed9]MDD1433761.1 cation-transporting P-type ATPase [Dolichospermum sp. ST_sed6]MDD1436845.1 cation-transporting P-type ATPase [Dolichospermum sp. ST_sed10]MDD1443249.1 cation-transporting P-type ATPase [Dolichospermum sp. ST_sed3]MDD1448907.1 cation-transporting P-type ATPase [Dolichospermum sp. ST_sed8]MDD1456300.1 cation-transporting P-type ATPase [Dolichos